jgi:hypothetical protein
VITGAAGGISSEITNRFLSSEGRDLHGCDIGPQAHEQSVNRGRHRIRSGGAFDSHLLLSVISD